jgi:hypothetical protein
MDEHDGNRDLRYTAMHRGVVVANDDPMKIGRVRVRVPGLIEPDSGWALPVRQAHGYDVPDVGAEVCVWFHQGDVDELQYAPGNPHAPSGQSELNSRVTSKSPADAPKVKLIETERWLIVYDDSAETPALLLQDKVSGDGIEYDGLTRAMTISATSALTIRSVGQVNIDAVGVTIMGRPVLPNGQPI